jgi:hypothetical protein
MNFMGTTNSKVTTNHHERKEIMTEANDNRTSLPFMQSFEDIVSGVAIPGFYMSKATLRLPETVLMRVEFTIPIAISEDMPCSFWLFTFSCCYCLFKPNAKPCDVAKPSESKIVLKDNAVDTTSKTWLLRTRRQWIIERTKSLAGMMDVSYSVTETLTRL